MRNYQNGGMNDYRNRSQMRPQQMQQQRQAGSSFNAAGALNGVQRQPNRHYEQGNHAAGVAPYDGIRPYAPWNNMQKQAIPKPNPNVIASTPNYDATSLMHAKVNRYTDYMKAPAVTPMPAQQSNYPVIMTPALSSFSVPPPALIYSYPPPHALPVKN